MGLDMYLNAKRYIWSFPEDGPDAKLRDAIQELLPELGTIDKDKPSYARDGFEVKGVTAEVGYWRKANAIHRWFVDNVQNGVDDCGDYAVEWEDLVKLRDLCKVVLEDRSLADKLLPAQSGFFFGSTDYNDWYFQDLEHTIGIIDRIDQQLVTETTDDGTRFSWWDFEYSSSW